MKDQTIREHLTELRKIFFFIFLPGIGIFILLFLLAPGIIDMIIDKVDIPKANLVTLTPLEGLEVYLLVASRITFMLLIPAILTGIYLFVKPTIPKEIIERSKVYLFSSIIVAIVGLIFGVTVTSKLLVGSLLTNYNIVEATWSLKSLMSFIFNTSLAMALVLQTIILIPLLNNLGLINLKKLKQSRFFVLFLILFFSGLVTPPDVISLIAIAIPFYISFEIGMFISKSKEVKHDRSK